MPKGSTGYDVVILSTDEYEAIRLVDFEKKTHEQCAQQMDISRTTVTEIYERARFKLADSIVNGKRLVIDHGMGIVIGETAEIGDDCLLYQGVTLGGTGKDKGKRHPTLGNNVMVGSGAKVLGPFKVGDNARIAANAVVLSEVPEDATAVGIPAQVVRIAGKTTHYADDVDQINVKDPVLEKLAAVSSRLELLEKLMDDQYLKNNRQGEASAESEE